MIGSTSREALRPILWALLWSYLAQRALESLGLPWWVYVPGGAPAFRLAFIMSVHRSLLWRWAVAVNYGRMQRPLVYDEDGALRGGMLPFERVCVFGDADGPIEGHVHTRTLVLGRPALRAETVWRRVP